MVRISRRQVLKGGSAGLVVGLAGCSGGDDGDDGGDGTGGGGDGGGGSTGTGGASTPTDTYSWEIATIEQEGGSYHTHAQEFAGHMSDLSGGRFDISVAGGGQYGAEPEQLELLKSGGIEMISQSACLPEALYGKPTYIICASFFVFDEPLFESYMNFRKAELQQLEIPRILDEAGVHLIAPEGEPQKSHVYGTPRGVAAKDPIRAPADAQGYPAGVAQASIIAAPLNGMGFETQTGPPTEAVSSLQQGIYDARETSLSRMYSSGLVDVVSHYMDWRHGMNASYLQINTDLYDSLAPYDQELLVDAQLRARDTAGEINRQSVDDAIERMRNDGVTVVQDFDREAIFNAGQEGLRSWFDENDPPLTVDEIVDLAEVS